jgi:hypothetical protein
MTRKFFFSEMGYNAYPVEAFEKYGYSALLFPNSIFDPEKGSRPLADVPASTNTRPRWALTARCATSTDSTPGPRVGYEASAVTEA